MAGSTESMARQQRTGGIAALYLAFAYLLAMPYFLLLVDYQGATTPADKVALIVANYASMYAMYLITYVVFGIVLGVLALALHDRTKAAAPFASRVAAGVGLLWAFALVASGMIFNYGMTTVLALAETNPTQAAGVWQAIEPIALGLGGAGGELLGGLWVLLVSWLALRGSALPRALSWLGIFIGAAGIVSVVPPLHDVAYAFGLLQIVWFVWAGVVLVRPKGLADRARVAEHSTSREIAEPVTFRQAQASSR